MPVGLPSNYSTFRRIANSFHQPQTLMDTGQGFFIHLIRKVPLVEFLLRTGCVRMLLDIPSMTKQSLSTPPPLQGLSSEQVVELRKKYGFNTITETKPNRWLAFLKKFWAPVPWMLEITLVIELYLGKYVETVVICGLLVFNALLSFLQEGRANNALALLRQKLSIKTRTRRDGHWKLIPAEELVPGDSIHLRMGDLIPADVNLMEGSIQIDQSTITGESLPVDAVPGQEAYAGTVILRGESTGLVTRIGASTRFGKTAELVKEAKTVSHLGDFIFTIVKYLLIADAFLVVLVISLAYYLHVSWLQILPFALIILIASVPVALPATFTLATALGSVNLANKGVLVTRLSAIEEAAAMTTLACDKTGTITNNQLTLSAVVACAPFREADVVRLGAQASRSATQDPLDLAIIRGATDRNIAYIGKRVQFTPFDPASKRSEVLIELEDGEKIRVIKGAPQTVISLSTGPDVKSEISKLAGWGNRVLAVASGEEGRPLQLVGLLGLQDTPRPDSKTLIQKIDRLGIRVIMVTGDESLTAKAIAKQVGIKGDPCPAEVLHTNRIQDGLDCNILAGVFPEDKLHLVQALQKSDQVVGMTGDGVNDAPALKQAEVGIAVANAADVAKAAASIVLTTPGLENILSAVEISRKIHQRMLTYTLNKIIKTFQIVLFLSLGFIITHEFVVTPLLVLLLLFANDFVTMSLATDNVSFSPSPTQWKVLPMMGAASLLAIPILGLSFGFLFVANQVLHLPVGQMQTLMFIMLVFTGQGNVYLVRDRNHLWEVAPSRWMLLGTISDVIIVSFLAARGILMDAIPLPMILVSLLAVALFVPCLDWLKVYVFKRTGIS